MPHCPTPVLPSMGFNLHCPSSSYCPIFLSRTLLHPGVQPTRNSPAVPAWVAVSEFCKGKSSAPQAMSWARIPEQKPSIREGGWLGERCPAGFPRTDFPKPTAPSQPGRARAVPETCWRADWRKRRSKCRQAALKFLRAPGSAFKSTVSAFQPSWGERLQPIRSQICFRGRVHPKPELQPLPDPRGSLLRTRGEEPRGTPGTGGKHYGILGWGGVGSTRGEGGWTGAGQEPRSRGMGCCCRRVEISMILSL